MICDFVAFVLFDSRRASTASSVYHPLSVPYSYNQYHRREGYHRTSLVVPVQTPSLRNIIARVQSIHASLPVPSNPHHQPPRRPTTLSYTYPPHPLKIPLLHPHTSQIRHLRAPRI